MESILPWSTSAMIIMPFLATSDFTAFVTSSNDLLEDTVTRSPLNESGAAATKDRRPGRGLGRCAPAGGRPGDLHRWRNASPVVSDPNDRGGRRFWRTYAGCVSMGPVVRRSGNRRPESRSTARLGRSEQASTASPPLCGRVHLPPRPHTAHRESNATQSESVGEFLVAPTLESCLPHSRIVPRGRGEILCEEVAELARLGATYIQIDAPHYALLIDPTTRRFYEQQAAQAGRTASMQQWLERALELDIALISAAPAVTYGFHLCRGNQDSRWLAEGSYEPIAPIVFQKIKAHRLLLEYDDVRSGSFEPLRLVPNDKSVVLGLITTKMPRM